MTIARALVRMRDAYPRQAFGDRAIKAYAEGLADLDDSAVYAAVDRLIRTSTWMPAIAEIRAEVAEQLLGLPTVEEAWDMVIGGAQMTLPREVKASVNAVGGMWEVNHGNRPEITRRAFRENYTGRRHAAIKRQQGGGSMKRPEQIEDRQVPTSLNARRLREIPESTSIRVRPVALRTAKRLAGIPLAVATPVEQQDAIRVLEAGGGIDDPLYQEASRIFDECGR